MILFKVKVTTRKNAVAEFEFEDFAQNRSRTEKGIRLRVSRTFPYKVTATPPKNDRIRSISYTVSTHLKNFHQVIVPDTGRFYFPQSQLVDFWGKTWPSRVNNIRMPAFILTGQDLFADFIFGVIGENYETDFIGKEPGTNRALIAWMKRFTVEIRRGTDEFPIPESVASAQKDGSITEYIYFKEGNQIGPRQTWIECLRAFSLAMAKTLKNFPVTTNESLLPYWCSWTDWFSDDVTDEVVLENVKEGCKLGIKNYIIDDGWFGPGLDNDFDIKINIGDWREDPAKIKDLKTLVEAIHQENANAIIWCAPHAVAPDANCFRQRKKYLIQNRTGKLLMTGNMFHSLCFMCPQAREIMADICADLIERYNVDGAKYDLFNCVPADPCISDQHEHDTTSMMEGLARTFELIEKKTKRLKPDYIVEMKQNYGTPWLYQYGTVMRAGDTPYNPEGNFLRTAYINAYTPYSLNDYQTITNHDSADDAAAVIIKMLAVGVPSYSINFKQLQQKHKNVIRFYHRWYIENLNHLKRGFRIPLDSRLGSWRADGKDKNIYFLLNNENQLRLKSAVDSDILNGTFSRKIYIDLPRKTSLTVAVDSVRKPDYFSRTYTNTLRLEVDAQPGDIIKIRPR